ncbi:MAG: S53 family peptidase [Singulisphaera sp.]|nr:S53 family peptidase [Singulisphaera sp.]
MGVLGRGARRSRLRLRRRAGGGYLGIDHLLERLEDRRLLDASPIAYPPFMIKNPGGVGPLQSSTPPTTAFTPAQIQKAYGIDSLVASGNAGQGQTVAIVDAFDNPNIASDLHNFDVQFGPKDPPSFTKVNQDGNSSPLPQPAPLGDWGVEEALDVEWVHSIAPMANIILVEANSPTFNDLIVNGVANAAKLPGVSVVSMSFGASEFSSDTRFDSIFQTPPGHNGVTFLASTGDNGAPGQYPAFSPNVVAVGGTSLVLNPDNSYKSESGWSGSGGGFSQFESQPPFQNVVTQNMTQRTILDVSFDADPKTGVAVYDSYDFGAGTPWIQVGGTSLSCPCWAGLIAIVNQERVDAGGTTLDGPTQTLPALYELYSDPAKYSSDFHDITSGYNVYPAGIGYDLVTGIGTPIANQLVPDLARFPLSVNVPRVVNLSTVPGRNGVSTILVTFSKPLNPQRAMNLLNYSYSVQIPGHNHRLGAPSSILVGLESAEYDAATQTVTLTTTTPIHPGTPILVVINQVTGNPSAGVGVADLEGILLAGNNDGHPGGVFMQTVIASGPSVRRPTRHSSVEKGAQLVHGPGTRLSVKLPTRLVAASPHRWLR